MLDCEFLWERLKIRPNAQQSSPLTSTSPSSTLISTSTISHHPIVPCSLAAPSPSVVRLRVCHFNANSIRAHIERVRLFLDSQPTFHIIGVTETKLGTISEDRLVSLKGYTLFRRDRSTTGGGVALYVHESLSATHICSSSTVWSGKPGYPEYLFCEVKPRNGPPMFVGVVYRPPHAPFIRGTDFIEKLTTHMHDYASKIIVGDFNADQLNFTDADAGFIRELLDENSLYSVPYGATHHTATSDTWLDLCLVDSNDTVVDFWKTTAPFIDGHDLITASIDILISVPAKSVFSYRNFNQVDSSSLNRFLNACNWSVIKEEGFSVEDAIGCLYDNLNSAMNELAPVQTFEFKKGKQPWFTDDVKSLSSESDRLYRRYRRTRLTTDLFIYRAARDKAHQIVESAKLDFFYNRLGGLTDPKEIWRELRHLGVAPTPENDLGEFTIEELNAHFAKVSFDSTASPLSEFLSSLDTATNAQHSFDFRDVTPTEVSDAIKFARSQAVGIDGIPQKFVALASDHLAPVLCSIFNRSLATSTFPEIWKQSVIIALNKVRPPSSPGDFRPISLLCFLSKVLERLVFNQLSNYLENHGLFDELQSGYRESHSTQTTLLKLTEDIRTGLDRKRLTALLLFDFSKAFDTVCHRTLLKSYTVWASLFPRYAGLLPISLDDPRLFAVPLVLHHHFCVSTGEFRRVLSLDLCSSSSTLVI